MYRTSVRPALMYGTDIRSTTKNQGMKLDVNEIRMLRWMLSQNEI